MNKNNRYISVRVLHRETGRYVREENFLTDGPYQELDEALKRCVRMMTATAMTYRQPGMPDRMQATFQVDVSVSAEV